MEKSGRIFVSVAEESADVHAAALVRTARERLPGVEFYGLTGPRLRELGVETVYDFASHAAMLGGVLGVVRRAWQAVQAVERAWRVRRPDLVVLLDSPELHLRLAKRAKDLGIPVLYYIAPQTWAARAYRNRRIARDIDRLACILPFEQEYFRRFGINAEYVGHPLFETLSGEKPIADTIEFLKARAGDRPVVALLPGSRRHVIDVMLPKQLEVVRRLRAAGTPAYAAISCVSEARRQQIRDILAANIPGAGDVGRGGPTLQGPDASVDAGVDIVVADNASLLTAADLVLVASGTAALHVAYYRKPMVVMYDAGRLLHWPYRLFGGLVVTTPHLSLVNILAGARVVPEFMPFIRDLGPVATVVGQLLTDEIWRSLMVRQLDEIVRPLESSEASNSVCGMISDMLRG
jgi:lipid-A-disaccharide synthase